MAHRVGIYSGTFDPVHAGHIAFAKEALERCGLDKVFFLVEPRPRRKQGVKALEHRQNMVHLAIHDESSLGHIILGHQRFTVDETLPALQARFKGAKIYFLMGDDMLTYFTDAAWPKLDEFIKAANLVIGARKRTADDIERHIALLEKTRGIKIKHEIFKADHALQTSTTVRKALRRGEQPAEINSRVYRYIQANGLYAAPADS